MIMLQEEVRIVPKIIEPNAVAAALFAAGRCVLHVDGRCVTFSVDGEYVTGVADGWADVVAVVDTAVSQFIRQYMADVVEPHMTATELASDAARYFGILPTQEAAVALLVGWAEQFTGKEFQSL